jgi:hypothetical protein
MEDLKKLLGKKDKKQDSMKKDVKLSALSNLRNAMSDIMKEGLNGKLSKVTVMSDDKEGLKEGLEKAKEMMESNPETEENPEMEEQENESCEENEEMSLEELESEMKKLEEKKKALLLKK